MLAFSVEGNHLGPWQVDKMTKNDEPHVNISVFSEAASASLYTRTLSILNAIPCLAALESYIWCTVPCIEEILEYESIILKNFSYQRYCFFWPLSVRLRSNQCRAIQRLPTSLRAWTLRRMEADRSHNCSKHHRISLQFCVDTRRSPAALLLLWQLFFPNWGPGHCEAIGEWAEHYGSGWPFSPKSESQLPFPRGPVERHGAELVAIQRGTCGTFPSTFGSEPESQPDSWTNKLLYV